MASNSLKGVGCGLFQSSIPVLVWLYWGKPRSY